MLLWRASGSAQWNYFIRFFPSWYFCCITFPLSPVSSGLPFLLLLCTCASFPCTVWPVCPFLPVWRFPAPLPAARQVGVMLGCTEGIPESWWVHAEAPGEAGPRNLSKREWAVDASNRRSGHRIKEPLKDWFSNWGYFRAFPPGLSLIAGFISWCLPPRCLEMRKSQHNRELSLWL